MSTWNENPQPQPQFKLPAGSVKKIVIGVIAAVIILMGLSMFYTVQEHERAAVMTFGKFSHEEGAGLKFKLPYPIQKVVIVPANMIQRIEIGYRDQGGRTVLIEEESLMITGDENIVWADAVVEYRVGNIRDYLYNIQDPEIFLRNASISAIRSVIGATNLDFAITEGKTQIQGEALAKLIELQEKYETGIMIHGLRFQDIEPPGGEVQQAFREVTNAREEKNTKINNANRYQNDIIPRARGDAQAMIERARADKESRILNAQGDVEKFNAILGAFEVNPSVTESRLIIETLEKIYPNAQIFITDGSGDTVQYLPLNELMRTQGGTAR